MRFQRPPFRDNRIRDNRIRDNRTHRDDSESESESGVGSREAEYLQDLADEKKTIVVHLRSGEVFRGFLEYYDKRFVRLTRQDAPNLFIFKRDIKYLLEE